MRLLGDKEKLKQIQKDLDVMIRKCKSDYKSRIEEQFDSRNVKASWDGLKSITGYTQKSKNIPVKDAKKLANDLNTFYSRFEKSDNSPDTFKKAFTSDNLLFEEISLEEVRRELKKVNPRKATGPDKFTARLLKICSNELCEIFHLIYNKSLKLGRVPNLWKTSTIIPVPKKANASELNDYRPVALTPVVMKSFERIVLNKLLSVVGPSLDKYQFAYKKHRGVEDATITVLNAIDEHLDKQGNMSVHSWPILVRPFNTIIASILVAKLDTLSVPIHICRWIWDFLTDRRQSVYVNGKYSGVTTINTRAPQGCVLSPELFTIYTNDSSHLIVINA